jgi:hypothetical protein
LKENGRGLIEFCLEKIRKITNISAVPPEHKLESLPAELAWSLYRYTDLLWQLTEPPVLPHCIAFRAFMQSRVGRETTMKRNVEKGEKNGGE